MNISKIIDNLIETLVIPAGAHRDVDQVGRYFLLMSNDLATRVQVAFGDSQHYTEWPVLYSLQPHDKDDFFDKVRFYNPGGAAMTIQYVISTEYIDNKSAEVTGTITIPIDDTSNGTVTPAAIIVQPRAGFLLDVGPAVNVGGGVVGLPLTSQPFSTGQAVTVSGCPQYDGAYTVLASSGANQVNITATFQGGTLDNAAAVDKGGGKVGIPITGHPYTAGETIRLAGTVNYNGDEVVDATTTVNEVVITAAYVAEVFTGAETHNLVFDGVNDAIALTTAQSIPASATQKELHITNHDDTYRVFWGDATVNATTHRGVIIQPDSVYILTCTDEIFLACEDGAGVTGCIVSWASKTKT